MSTIELVLSGSIACFILQGALWLWQYRTSEADVVDLGWTACLGFLAVWFSLHAGGDWGNRALVSMFAVSWSLRLGLLLLSRIRRPGEDERYRELRIRWGNNAQRNFFILFMAQAFLALLLSTPFLVISLSPEMAPTSLVVAAIFVWAGSILGEAVSDRQLKAFKVDPSNRGKTCRVGLWRYSRHPNYFFEWLYWWSFVVLGITLPWGILTLVGPLLMYWFLMKITGIPASEARAVLSRGDDYREYQRTTNAFFPWKPVK